MQQAKTKLFWNMYIFIPYYNHGLYGETGLGSDDISSRVYIGV